MVFSVLDMHRLDRHLHILLLRKREDKFASLALLGCKGDLLAVSLDDLLGYCQSQSGSGLLRSQNTVKRVKDTASLGLRNPRAVVGHTQTEAVA